MAILMGASFTACDGINSSSETNSTASQGSQITESGSNVLVVYFSATRTSEMGFSGVLCLYGGNDAMNRKMKIKNSVIPGVYSIVFSVVKNKIF